MTLKIAYVEGESGLQEADDLERLKDLILTGVTGEILWPSIFPVSTLEQFVAMAGLDVAVEDRRVSDTN